MPLPGHPQWRLPAPRNVPPCPQPAAPARRRALGVLAAAGLFAWRPATAQAREVPIGGLLPDVALQGLNGPSRRLAQYRGRQLLINVWASWCGPCMDEMASIERLAWMDGRIPFALIGISTDDYPDEARAALRRGNATISHYIDHAQELETLLGAARIPLTVLVGVDGRVLDKIHGARQWDAPDALRLIARAFGRDRALTQG
jgi:thiol-disulfide isomerase/thioredoxin